MPAKERILKNLKNIPRSVAKGNLGGILTDGHRYSLMLARACSRLGAELLPEENRVARYAGCLVESEVVGN